MNRLVMLALLGALAAPAMNSHAQSTVIHFTAAEGYVNGPLDTQHNSDWWKSGSSTAWQVDTNDTGSAFISSTNGNWNNIAYNLGTPFTNGYVGALDFWFTLSAPAGSDQLVLNCKPQDSANSYKGPAFEFKAAFMGDFSISIWNEVSGGFIKTYFRGADIGMADGTGTSAKLRMMFTTTSAGPDKWTTVYSLLNLDTSNTLASVTLTGWAGQGWASHIRMEEGTMNTITGDGGLVSVDQITIGPVVEPPPPPKPSTVVDFTAAEGYVNGPLDTQHNSDWWKSGSSTAWQVDTNDTGIAFISSTNGNWNNIAYNLGTPFTNGYIGTLDFWFTLSAPAGSDQLVLNCKPQDSANSYKGPAFEFKAAFMGDFSISIWNEVSGGFVKTYFSGADIGMTDGTGTSAKLRMMFTTSPDGPDKWTTVYSLRNVDTSNTLATVTLTGWAGQGWASHIRMEEGTVNTITGDGGLINVDQITMGQLSAPAETVLKIQDLGNGKFRLEWPNGGILQQSTTLAADLWQPVTDATSPYTNSVTGGQSFFRVSQ